MSDIAIRVDHLSKLYTIGAVKQPYHTLADKLVESVQRIFQRNRRIKDHHNTIWALKDASFEIRQGEAVGIIGHNGAGKSTLLKILSRITEPTEGRASIYGRVASLLEVGTGFHQELTGRENVYLNGALLGMQRAEITRKFDEIIVFSGVERFVDTPVKHYSSGMKVRLAFSVAAHLEPEILLIDEVLAVGDAAFQRKCLGKMGDVVQGGRTVLFVSHNMGSIAQFCQRVFWFENGQLKLDGSPPSIIAAYLESEATHSTTWTNSTLLQDDMEAYMKYARIVSLDNNPAEVIEFNRSFKVEISYKVINPIRNLSIICRVTDAQGTILWTGWDTDTTRWNGHVREPGEYLSVCIVPGNLLKPGHYLISIGALVNRIKALGYYENALGLHISEVGYHLNLERLGVIAPPLKWEVQPLNGKP